jgi:hypothetical protein
VAHNLFYRDSHKKRSEIMKTFNSRDLAPFTCSYKGRQEAFKDLINGLNDLWRNR